MSGKSVPKKHTPHKPKQSTNHGGSAETERVGRDKKAQEAAALQKQVDIDQQILKHEETKKTSNTPLDMAFTLRKVSGNQLEKVPDLDPQWCSGIDILPYVPLFGERSYLTPSASNLLRSGASSSSSSSSTSAEENMTLPPTTVIEILEFYQEDLNKLLSMNHQLFWCHVFYKPCVLKFIDTFLRFCPRPYEPIFKLSLDSQVYDSKMQDTIKQVMHLTYLVILRLSTNPEQDGFLSKDFYSSQIHKRQIFDIPRLMDVVSIYGKHNYDQTRKIVNDIMRSQPLYMQDLLQCCDHIFRAIGTIIEQYEVFESSKTKPTMKGKLTPSSVDASVALDTIDYLLDITHTLAQFCKIYYEVMIIFQERGMFQAAAKLYEHTLSSVQESLRTEQRKLPEAIYDKIMLIRENLLSMANSTLQHYYFDFLSSTGTVHFHIITKKPVEVRLIADEFMGLMTEMISPEEEKHRRVMFLRDLNEKHQFIARTVNLRNKDAWMDEHQLDFLLRILADQCHLSDGEVDRIFGDTFTSTAAPIQRHQKASETGGATSEMKQVKEVFPDLGYGFIRKLLAAFNSNVEQTIQSLLEENIPPSLVGHPRDAEDEQISQEQDATRPAVTSKDSAARTPTGSSQKLVTFSGKRQHGGDGSLFRSGQSTLIRNLVSMQLKEERELEGSESRVENEFMFGEETKQQGGYDDEYDDTWDQFTPAPTGDGGSEDENEDKPKPAPFLQQPIRNQYPNQQNQSHRPQAQRSTRPTQPPAAEGNKANETQPRAPYSQRRGNRSHHDPHHQKDRAMRKQKIFGAVPS
eukprot:TRINITY_DN4903_c0_g1_i1.p1 TRINITY_DN4903_c0_g1~~TRINITY_DN4903_c0_g1_i1.p1  ORF type:complete len:801 (+),score=172.94 TRINITY_DN4903_c0_g1_i1:93-2495(+)